MVKNPPAVQETLVQFLTIKNVTEDKKKEKLKTLIIFHSANKIYNHNGGGEKMKKKKIQKIYRTCQNIKIINVFCDSLLSEYFLSLGVIVHFTFLGCSLTLC